MEQTAMPTTVEDRVRAGAEIIGRLTKAGVPLEKIYIDPLIQPVSIDTRMATAALGAISKIMADFPGVRTICGLSNVSFGLPCRSLLNRNFLALAMHSGLSAAILDPTDRKLMSTLRAVQLLLDQDDYCQQYIEAYQQDALVG
jgi:5-methyltetrahydrofolate--homocysteine methyltransferase